MNNTPDQHSLFLALDRISEKPVPRGAYEVILRKFLVPDEFVHLAFDGNGWTFLDPLLLVTDRRILRLREGVFGGWAKRGEVPAADVMGASVTRWILFGAVNVHARNGQSFRVHYNLEDEAQVFVEGLNRLIGR
ncbi:PH domain-containing protein [Brachybacterium sacelli]|uniref:YokE-like PH domain-containing protein n=1 Tax=Brachybacterium sacelli TaxID=173364 RepID=A0ABS4WWT4_9MICO|nr:hypothetical protein [Brachybacterium sacelli]